MNATRIAHPFGIVGQIELEIIAKRLFQRQFEAARRLPVGIAYGIDLSRLAFERIYPIRNIIAGVQPLIAPIVCRNTGRIIGHKIPIHPHFHTRRALGFHAIGRLPRRGMHFHSIPLFGLINHAIAVEIVVRGLA